MMTIDAMHEILDEISREVPEEFYRELNGGVILLEDEVLSPEAADDDLYTLGEYCEDELMGRYIVIYYGSFQAVFAQESEAVVREELRETLFHEFTHHLESLAGEYGLEIKDEEELRKYFLEKQDGG